MAVQRWKTLTDGLSFPGRCLYTVGNLFKEGLPMSEYSGNIRDLPVVTGGHFIENFFC